MNDDQRPAVDPLASQRAELLGSLRSTSNDLSRAIADLARSGANTAGIDAQIARLTALQSSVSTAGREALTALAGQVAAAVAQSQTMMQEAQETTVAVSGTGALTPAEARKKMDLVARDLWERHTLDPYLRFTSKEDEEAYRRREQENREAYAREMEKGTEEGRKRAYEIQNQQLADAKEHGAGDSPEFSKMAGELAAVRSSFDEPQKDRSAQASGPVSTSSPESSGKMDDVLAALKAAGVSSLVEADGPGHGLSVGKKPQAGAIAHT